MSDEDETTVDETEEQQKAADEPKPESKGRDSAIAAERRKARAAEKRAEEAERKLADLARKEQEAEGRWQEIAEQERTEREKLEQQVADRDKRDAITTAATRLKFKNPTIAHRLLSDEEITDERSAEQALQRLAKAEPYLLQDAPVRTGLPAADGEDGNTEDPLARAGAGLLATINAKRAGR